jgi:GNAT superfamily N-acetyltransferase
LPPLEITIEQDTATSTANELGSRLRQFNEERAGPLNWKTLVLSIRDDSGSLIAGLSGGFFWNTLFIDIVWVDEPQRRKGYGSSLLGFAEREASEQGYDVIYLSSFAFQAPEFYSKQGYYSIGELADSPRGSKRYWFSKHLDSKVG